MQKNHLLLTAFSLLLVVFTACKKDDEKTYADLGSVEIEFDNRAGDDGLVLGQDYVTAAGETVNFSTFDYYISNVVLVREDGTEYIVPKNESYFLIKQGDESTHSITINNVPGGAYKAARFVIGVDSLMCATPAEQRPAILDPITAAAEMYWTWNSGYIFVKVEGTSPQAPVDASTQERNIVYHIGGYGGNDPASPTMNNLKTVTIEKAGELAQVGKLESDDHDHDHNSTGIVPHFHTYVDILEVFTQPTTFKVADTPILHWGDFAKTVAANYSDMFKLDHIHN